VKFVKCGGDPVEVRREYPSRPEEAFEAASESVLDPLMLSRWSAEAKENPPELGHFTGKSDKYGELTVEWVPDNLGYVSIWEDPIEGMEYAMGVDPATGSKEGDWFVASVLRADTGAQVAEFRARIDPDLCTDQVEALGVYFNSAFTGIEANSYGLHVAREIEDRGTLPMYEREIPDSRSPGKTIAKIGWVTDRRTRNNLMTELRKAVREGRCQIRSEETLREGRTLYVNRTQAGLERIEARPNCHDDGIFAHSIGILMRNRLSPPDEEYTPPIAEDEVHPMVEELLKMNRKDLDSPRLSYNRGRKEDPKQVILQKFIDPDRRSVL
jgi:hypothetical protein